MRLTIRMAVLLAVLSGGVGAFAFSQLSGEAGAAPTTAPRQDVISIIAGSQVNISGPSTGAWVEVRDSGPASFRLPLDASHYPANTGFRLEVAGNDGGSFPPVPVCVRLSEVITGGLTAVTGSDVCAGGSPGPFSASSASFTLSAGPHLYTLEASGNANLFTTGVRIVAEWTERTR